MKRAESGGKMKVKLYSSDKNAKLIAVTVIVVN